MSIREMYYGKEDPAACDVCGQDNAEFREENETGEVLKVFCLKCVPFPDMGDDVTCCEDGDCHACGGAFH